LRAGLTDAQILLAEIRESERRWNDAIARYRAIDPDSPYSWLARLRTANALNQLGRTEDAADILEAMATERTDRTDALSQMADMYRAKDRFAEAAEAYSAAITRIPELQEWHWSILYARGIAYERSKQWPKAEADFLKALELKPDQPLVLNYLGYSWVEKGLNIDRAKGMIEKAVELRPNDGYIVDSLGWVLYRLGDYAGAVKHLEKAVELKPDDPVINDHLGDAYWRVGRRFEARFQWRRALSFEPEKELVPAIEKKIEAGLTQDQSGERSAISNGG
jgi:Flp pilus assembly protein TadD